MSNEQKPSAIRFDEAIDSLGIGLCDRPEFRWKVSELLARARREARAEAFEEAEAAMYSDDVVFVTHHGQAAWQSCLLKLRALAAKERAS